VHAERLIHKLDTFTDRQHAAQQLVRALVWWFYADLKAYKRAPERRRRHEPRARFDRIFRRRTGFATLDRLLARLHANKEELLLVLERPEVPLNTNGSERDLRPQVVKRKISGGTRSDAGRACRDAFLGLPLTCAKLGVSFRDYLGHRLGVPGADAPSLPDFVRLRSAPARLPGLLPLKHDAYRAADMLAASPSWSRGRNEVRHRNVRHSCRRLVYVENPARAQPLREGVFSVPTKVSTQRAPRSVPRSAIDAIAAAMMRLPRNASGVKAPSSKASSKVNTGNAPWK
jgi:hypothetical protein